MKLFLYPNSSSIMAPLVFLLLILGMVGGSDGGWCVCKPDAVTSSLQKSLDYACGAGADCNPIHQNGACYNPNTVPAHCSYAVNSYYQRNGQNAQACDFSGTAQVVNTDPSPPGCTYPATPSAAGTSSTPSTSTGTGTGTGTSTGTSTGTGTGTGIGSVTGTGTGGLTPTGTGGGGVISTLGPSGVGFDGSDGGLHSAVMISLFLTTSAILLSAVTSIRL